MNGCSMLKKIFVVTLLMLVLIPARVKAIGSWNVLNEDNSKVEVLDVSDAVCFKYSLSVGNGWVSFETEDIANYSNDSALIFELRAVSTSDFEIKFVDADGSVFGKKFKLSEANRQKQEYVIYLDSLEHWWGGDSNFNEIKSLSFAVSGKGSGKIEVLSPRFEQTTKPASFPPAGPQTDPYADVEGFGDKARRHEKLIPEDKGVYEYLKVLQDMSPDKNLVSAQEDDYAQTFNNSLAAMAFILKGDRPRAERIFDFYAKRTDKQNTNPHAQQFFLNGEARGFYQNCLLNPSQGRALYDAPKGDHRWMGDMAWLLLALTYYEREYSAVKYRDLANLLESLMKKFFIDSPEGIGGFVQHGWRNDDEYLHEDHGHAEVNIDAYAVFRLRGEMAFASKIKKWLKSVLDGRTNLWLDQYTWRALAFGRDSEDIINQPEHDLRFRKTIDFKGRKVTGMYHAPEDVQNIWLDGTAHLSCAEFMIGDIGRGNYYSNQLDKFIFERLLEGRKVKALPYTANNNGPYDWVDTNKGFSSIAAWYIFTKEKFNPLRLEVYRK